jgi:hypothetical protein
MLCGTEPFSDPFTKKARKEEWTTGKPLDKVAAMKLNPQFDKVFWLLVGSSVVSAALCVELVLSGTVTGPAGMRIGAAVCALTGTVLLTVRLRRIHEAFALVGRVHDKNFEQAADSGPNQIIFGGASKHVERAQANGVKFLVVGIVLLVLAAALTVYAVYLERPAGKAADQGGPANGKLPFSH